MGRRKGVEGLEGVEGVAGGGTGGRRKRKTPHPDPLPLGERGPEGAGPERQVGAVIWVGPTLVYLRPGAAFNLARLPKFLLRYINQCPEVATLLVAAGEYFEAREEVKRVGSKLWAAAEKVRKWLVASG